MNAASSREAGSAAAPGDTGEPVGKLTFRQGMSRLAAAVSVVTTDGPGGQSGSTVSAACSVSDTPPSLLVCINRASRSHAAILQNRVLCLNVLGETGQPLADLFAGFTGAAPGERFAQVSYSTLATGAPALDAAIVAFDCELVETVEVGTHSVFIARVVAMAMKEAGDGLVYHGRRYLSTSSATPIGATMPLSIAFDLEWLR